MIRETLYGCTFQCGEMFLCLKWSYCTLFYRDIMVLNRIEKENSERNKHLLWRISGSCWFLWNLKYIRPGVDILQIFLCANYGFLFSISFTRYRGKLNLRVYRYVTMLYFSHLVMPLKNVRQNGKKVILPPWVILLCKIERKRKMAKLFPKSSDL